MKKWTYKLVLVSAIACATISCLWELYDFFVTNDGVRFYVSQPQHVSEVFLITVIGTGLVMAYSKLSSRTQHLTTLAFWAACALAASVLLIQFISLAVSDWTTVGSLSPIALMAGILVSLLFASALWAAFYLKLRSCKPWG